MRGMERMALNNLRVPDPRVLNAGWKTDRHEDGSWSQEKAGEYEQHGGPHGYIRHLAADIRQNGVRKPVLLDDLGQVQDGQHRVWAARAAGLTHVPVVRR